eukprot:jgi/Bigna1/82219/fgenesh1_pg.89_\
MNSIVTPPSPRRSSLKRNSMITDFDEKSWPFSTMLADSVNPFDTWVNDETLLSSYNSERKRCDSNMQALKKAKIVKDEQFFKTHNEILTEELQEAKRRTQEVEEKLKKMELKMKSQESKARKNIRDKNTRIKILEGKLKKAEKSEAKYKEMHSKLKLHNIQNRQIEDKLWSYTSDTNEFRYPPSIQNMLNEKWKELLIQNASTIMIKLDNRQQYTIDFLSMTQQNNKTGFRRRIKMTTRKDLFDTKWTRTWECNIDDSSTGWVAYSEENQKKLRAVYDETFILTGIINERKFEIDFNDMTHREEGLTMDTYKVVFPKPLLDHNDFSKTPIPSMTSRPERSVSSILSPSAKALIPLIDCTAGDWIDRNQGASLGIPIPPQAVEIGQQRQSNLASSSRSQIPSTSSESQGQIKRTLTSSTPISKDASEYVFVFGQFFLNCDKDLKKKVNITRIDAYETPKLTSQYLMMKSKIEHGLMQEGLISEEMWVYHGTKSTRIDDIMSSGFKIGGIDAVKANGSAHGLGIYTSKTPMDPIKYSSVGVCRHRKKKGMIIMARSIVGKKDVHSWSPTSNKDWMVFRRSEQLLPSYVVHYEFS